MTETKFTHDQNLEPKPALPINRYNINYLAGMVAIMTKPAPLQNDCRKATTLMVILTCYK